MTAIPFLPILASRPPRTLTARAPFFAAMLLYLLLLISHLLVAIRQFNSPLEQFHGPSVLAFHASRAAAGQSIYSDLSHPPYVAAVYGPFAYYLPALIGRILHADIQSFFAIGRALSMAAAALAAILVYKISRRLPLPRPYALIAALSASASPINWIISAEFRAEPMALAFSLLALYIFIAAENHPARRLAPFAILIAFLFKFSAIIPLPAIAIYLWTQRRRHEALAFFAITSSLLVLSLAFLNLATDGRFWISSLAALQGNRTLSNLAIWPLAVLPVCLAQYAFAAIHIRESFRLRRLCILEVYFIFSLIIPFLMTWRDGAAEYYFSESIALASILMAACWHKKQDAPRHGPALTLNSPTHPSRLIFTLLLTLPALSAMISLIKLDPTLARRLAEFPQSPHLNESANAALDLAARRLDSLPQPVLCEIDSLSILSENPPLILDTWLFSGLIDQRRFNDAPIRDALTSGTIPVIILRNPPDSVRRYGNTTYIPRPWLPLIARHYRPAGRLAPAPNDYYVYRHESVSSPELTHP